MESKTNNLKQKATQFNLKESILILVGIILIMSFSVIYLKISPEVPILISIILIIGGAKLKGVSWKQIDNSFVMGIKNGIIPLFILLLIGALIGIWILAGIIPSMMVFGFHLISAKWFLPSIFVVTALVGTAVGSAFTVISTLGVAFMGMGLAMHMDPAMVAGAILSGAIFGDKSSPLSATNNLTSAVVGADLIDHIKNIMWSTIPALLGSFIIFLFIGQGNAQARLQSINTTLVVLHQHFVITNWAVLPIALLFICAWTKIPTVTALFVNIIVSAIMAILEQPNVNLIKINNVLVSGFIAHTGNKNIDSLLSRGGISSMMGTITLIFVALALGGLLMNLGIIDTAKEPITKHLKKTFQLITSTIMMGIFVNIFIGEKYLSIILPGNTFNQTFRKNNLAPVALSRTLEDGGTVINYLIPWGVAGSFVANALGVPTLHYLPFVFFSLLSPVFSILSGITGIGIKHLRSKSK